MSLGRSRKPTSTTWNVALRPRQLRKANTQEGSRFQAYAAVLLHPMLRNAMSCHLTGERTEGFSVARSLSHVSYVHGFPGVQ
eukprot:6211316-Pleurochrysis_carterae.AAC.7